MYGKIVGAILVNSGSRITSFALLLCLACVVGGCDTGGKGYAKEAFKLMIAEKYYSCTASNIKITNCALTRTELNAQYYAASGNCDVDIIATGPGILNGTLIADGDRLKGHLGAEVQFAKGSTGKIEVTRYSVNSIDLHKN
jgi:hypothetical protein